MPKPYPDDLYALLSCVCSSTATLQKKGELLSCDNCGMRHPIVDGIPVLLHREKSVFDADEVVRQYRSSTPNTRRNLFERLRRFVPSIGSNIAANRVVDRMREMLQPIALPRILVVGGGESGAGLQDLLDDPRYAIVESDVYFGPRCNIIADGHNLPFQSNSFDAVICQAVLEHVVRPQACIDEIHRVLKPRGVLFADVPFMYPVHMGAYDFTRFSLGGLRLACRWFEECDAGISGGPWQAVAHTIFHSARALSTSRIWSAFVWFVLPWFIFWLHYADNLVKRKQRASDAASGVYFVGRKSDRPRTEREIIRQYWRYAQQPKRQRV
jgi:SAM-dependent methyltransferase